MGDEGQGGGAPVGGADPLPGPVDMLVDRALGDVEEPGDLLGLLVARHQPQAFPLARRQGFEATPGIYTMLPHRWRVAQAARNASQVNLIESEIAILLSVYSALTPLFDASRRGMLGALLGEAGVVGRVTGLALISAVALAACEAPPEWEEQTNNRTAVIGFWDRNSVEKTATTARMNTAEIRVYQPLDADRKPTGEREAIGRERGLMVDCDWDLVAPASPTAFEVDERGRRKKQAVRDSQDNPFPIGWEAGLFDRFCEGPRGKRSALYLRFNQIVRRAVAADRVWQGKPEDVYTADRYPLPVPVGPWTPVKLDDASGRALYIAIDPGSRVWRQATATVLTLVRGDQGDVRFLAARSYAFECDGKQRIQMLGGLTQDLEQGRKAVLGAHGPWPTANLPVTVALRTAACAGLPPADAPANLAEAMKDAEKRWSRSI